MRNPPSAMRMRAARALGLLVLAASAVAAQAQTAPAAPELPPGLRAVQTLASIHEYRLPNGLQILLMPVPDHPVTRVTLTYRVGSRHEGPGEAGMAHLLEHVTFRGTSRLPDLSGELHRLAVQANGTTTTDRTNYLSTFSPDSAVLRQVLQLEASRMTEARLAEADFLKEKPIVFNEMGLRAAGTAPQMAFALPASVFRQHPYGRPVIGFTPEIETLSLSTLRNFYKRHYRPDNAVLMIAGSFDTPAALAAVSDAFGPLQATGEAPAPSAAPAANEPDQQGPRTMTLRTPQTAIGVAYRVPGLAHPDAAALSVMAAALGAASNAFLERRKIAGQVARLGAWPRTREPFVLGLWLTLPSLASQSDENRAQLDELEERWLDYLDRAFSHEIALRPLIARMSFDLAQALNRQLREPAAASALVSDAVGAGDWRLMFKLAEALPKVDAQDVMRVAGNYLRPLNRSVVRGVADAALTVPRYVEAPPGFMDRLFNRRTEVGTVDDASQGLDAIKPQAAPAGAGGDAFDADPAALEKRVRRYRLPSGILVATLAREAADERVTALLDFRWGTASEMARLQGWRGLVKLAERGTEQRSATAVHDLVRVLHAQIRLFSGPQGVRVELTTRKAHLLTALVLIKELLASPALAAESFEADRREALAALKSAASAPEAAAWVRQRAHANQQRGLVAGDPGYLYSPAEQTRLWQELDLDQVRAFHRTHWSANDARIAVTGPLPDKLLSTIETLFSDWKKPGAPGFVRHVESHQPIAGARFATHSRDAKSATVSLLQDVPLARESERYAPALLGLRVLAGQATTGTRLSERLRQQEAISYSAQAGLSAPARGQRALVSIVATGAPESAAHVETVMREEIERLLRDGVGAEELDTARRRLLDERRQSRGTDRGLVAALLTHFDSQSGFNGTEAREDAAIAAVTPADISTALRELLLPGHWVAVIVGLPTSATPGN